MISPLFLRLRSVSLRRFAVSLVPALLFVAGLFPASAQIGGTNPTGPAGAFNGSITTGCNYDPATGNSARVITDLSLPSVGAYPLAFTRYSNSRGYEPLNHHFGQPGNWWHSYTWYILPLLTANRNSLYPTSYEVQFPDGRDETFTSAGARTTAGITDKIIPLNNSTMLTYVVLPDGGKVEFMSVRTASGNGYLFMYQAQALIDPYGNRTTFTNDPENLLQVTEPGGKWIQLFYSTQFGEIVLDHITASDGRTVQYTYQSIAPSSQSYCALTNVTYFGDNTIQAAYTYQAANGGNPAGTPLLATCDDPMYAGPMKKISYTYATSNADTSIPVAAGQIASENSGTTGQVVSQLVVPVATPSGSKRTENRGDGPSRSFTYNTSGLLTSFTDFNGVAATQGYDTNAFLNSYTDRKGNQTNLTNDPGTGNILKIMYPIDPERYPDGNASRDCQLRLRLLDLP